MKDSPTLASGTKADRRKVFYGWWIVAAGSALNALAGGTYWTGFSVYFLPVTEHFNLSRAATSLAYGLARLEGGFEGPLAGYMVDRLGPRMMIGFGGAIAGLGFILLALTPNFTLFLVVYIGVLSVGMNAGFNHGVMAAVNQWFVRRKGLAMSITTMGISIGGAVITPAVAFVVLNYGWRPAAVVSGLGIIAVSVPLAFVVRRSPESMGFLPDGDRPDGDRPDGDRPNRDRPDRDRPDGDQPDGDLAPAIAPRNISGTESRRFGRHYTTVDFTAKEAFKTPAYWLLALAMGTRIAAHTGVFVHLVPLIVWKGQSEATGAFVVAFIAFTTIPLRLFIGWVGDKWAKQKIVGITMGLGAVSVAILLLSGGGMWQLLIFAALFAFAEGVSGLSWSLIGDFFGRKSFGTLRGGVTTIHSFLSMGVPVYAGWVFDTSGSYHWALIPIIFVYVVAALLFWNLPRPRPPSQFGTGATGLDGEIPQAI